MGAFALFRLTDRPSGITVVCQRRSRRRPTPTRFHTCVCVCACRERKEGATLISQSAARTNRAPKEKEPRRQWPRILPLRMAGRLLALHPLSSSPSLQVPLSTSSNPYETDCGCGLQMPP